MAHTAIRNVLVTVLVIGVVTGSTAGISAAAPGTTAASVTTGATSAGQRVGVHDQLAQSQAQRALNYSRLGHQGLVATPYTHPYDAGTSGDPFFDGMLADTSTSKAVLAYSAGRQHHGEFDAATSSFVYSTPTGAARSMTRQLNYLAALRANPAWTGNSTLFVHRVGGVGDDAYAVSLTDRDINRTTLIFRQGNIITELSIDTFIGVKQDTIAESGLVRLAQELTAWQRRTHSTSGPTARVSELGIHPIRTETRG